MRGVITRLARCSRATEERGAVMVLVGVLLAAGVLTGMLAIVIDLGRVYAERRVVQNAADAGALALAQHCARASTDPACASSGGSGGEVQQLANANSPDSITRVSEVCGSSPLSACQATTKTWSNCTDPPGMPKFARVRTSTEVEGGDFFFPALFGGITSADGKAKLSAAACAQAAWGSAGSAMVVLPFVLPACPDVPFGEAVVIEDFDPAHPNTSCTTLDGTVLNSVTKGFAFADLPSDNRQCTVPVMLTVGQVLAVETSLTQLCGPDITKSLDPYIASGQSLIFPVVGGHEQAGQGQYAFNIIAFRSFVLLGYSLKGKQGGQQPPGGWKSTVCAQGSKRSCIIGTFLQVVVPGDLGTGPNLGVQSIALIP